MNFIISGGYGYGNVGDEAQLAGILNELSSEFSGSSHVVLTPNLEYTLKQHITKEVVLASRVSVFFQQAFPALYNVRHERDDGLIKSVLNNILKMIFWILTFLFVANGWLYSKFGYCFASSNQREIFKGFKKSDVFFVSGGGYLTEATLSRLIDTSMLIIVASIFNCKIFVSGQTIGFLKGRLNRWFFKKAILRVQLISTRDPIDSIKSVESIMPRKYHENIMFTSDDALFVNGKRPAKSYQGYVGIQLHFWGSVPKEKVISFFDNLITWLKEDKKHQVVLFCQHPSDEAAANEILSRHSDIELFEYDYGYEENIGFIQELDLVISMKHHPLIFAFGAGVPAVSINHSEYYVHKNLGALRNFNFERFTVMLNDTELSELKGLIETLFENIDAYHEAIIRGLAKATSRRSKYWKRVKEIC
jgi:polysaccharide pyruvyl transferase WcaK-like protein